MARRSNFELLFPADIRGDGGGGGCIGDGLRRFERTR